jgi:aconitate hydratase
MAARTLTAQLIESHRLDGDDELVALNVDQALLEDATGVMAAQQFEPLGVDRCRVPLAVCYVDHNVLQLDEKNKLDHLYLQAFCRRYGIHYSKPGNGISHYIHLERFDRPGALMIGADSHTSMAGAVGMLAIGVGGLEVAVAMAGHAFELPPPHVVGVELQGRLAPGVQAKDIVLELLRRHDVRGAVGWIFEFHGAGVQELSVTERATICNMVVETGATTGVFPSDARTRDWLELQGRGEQFVPLAAEPGASYNEVEAIDLDALEPLVAQPSSPGNVVPVADLAGAEISQVCVGSSVNSSFADLATVAAALSGEGVHPSIDLTVTPGSRQILEMIVESGVYGELVRAGARILEPICGPCIGVGQAPAPGAGSLRTFNRNFPGRSGTVGDRVYLCSPATAAASAVTGRISDPRSMLKRDRQRQCTVPERVRIDDRQILAPATREDRAPIELPRSENIVAPPEAAPIDETLEVPVLIVVDDDVSTGDMAPDGALGMALWGNIPACARFMFRRLDPCFYERARAAGGGLIVAGHNYGQGSSREQAALSAVHLGVRGVVAKSFARIHRRNLALNGILPLRFLRAEDYETAREGRRWRLEGVRAAVESGARRVSAKTGDGTIELAIELLAGEREPLLAGGLRELIRESAGGRRGASGPTFSGQGAG